MQFFLNQHTIFPRTSVIYKIHGIFIDNKELNERSFAYSIARCCPWSIAIVGHCYKVIYIEIRHEKWNRNRRQEKK